MPAERDQADRIIREGPAGRPNLQEHIVLALMVIAKWDQAYDQFGADRTPDEVANCDAFTDREVQAHRDTAGRMVTYCLQSAVDLHCCHSVLQQRGLAWGSREIR